MLFYTQAQHTLLTAKTSVVMLSVHALLSFALPLLLLYCCYANTDMEIAAKAKMLLLLLKAYQKPHFLFTSIPLGG